MKTDDRVIALAARAGLEVRWTDAAGVARTVAPDTLRAVLRALGLPADSAGELSDSEAQLRREAEETPPLVVASAGDAVRVPGGRPVVACDESGKRRDLVVRETGGHSAVRAPRERGYYRIGTKDREFVLAVAPQRCLMPHEAAPQRQLAGIAVQIYALRGGTSGAFGDFAALGQFARDAGRRTVDAILASPTHAQFGADPSRFSPYSPSTRMFPDPLFADARLAGEPARPDDGAISPIDWRSAGPAKYQALREAFARFRDRAETADFERFCRDGGKRLLAHALFESLDAHYRARGVRSFPRWPEGVRSSGASGISSFAREHKDELEYRLFLQWLAQRSAAAAQTAARQTMAIGIIADIAVGIDPEGSHAWSARDELLEGLHVGAPPDIFNTAGQDWGLTTFSPRAMRRSGFAGFIALLEANMKHAGGVRLDHAMGLRRLWVIPSGAAASEGVYLAYPERELLALVALESRRHRCIVIGEDLGTVPEGFRAALTKAGIAGMQVLWFERNGGGKFAAPGRWRRGSTAMTTTHDLPTVAGWWSGYDIELRKRSGILGADEQRERADRVRDRNRIWEAFVRAKCAGGAPPPPEKTGAAVSAALAFVGRTRSALAIAAAEDVAGLRDQPNLPGTIDEHPNWRLRLPPHDLFRDSHARARLETFLATRRAP